MKEKFDFNKILDEQKERFEEAEKSLELLHQTAKKLYALQNWNSPVYFDIHLDDYDMTLEFQGRHQIVFSAEFEGRFGPYDVDFITINITKDGEINIVNLGPLLEIKYTDIKEYTEKVLAMAEDVNEYTQKVLYGNKK